MRVSFITLSVSDVKQSQAFYKAFLQLDPVRVGTDHVFFNLEGTVLALFGAQAMAQETGAPSPGGGSVALSWNVDAEPDVQDALQRALQAGGTQRRSPHRKPWGALAAWIADPDGHPWEVVCNPGLPRRPDGGVDLR